MSMFAPTTFYVNDGAEQVMKQAEAFFIAVGAGITKRTLHSVRVMVAHPDGFETDVVLKYFPIFDSDDVVEVLRHAGDKLLFCLVCRMLVSYDFGRGTAPLAFYDGQMLPRPMKIQSSPPPFLELPLLHLDCAGRKRKADEIAEIDYNL